MSETPIFPILTGAYSGYTQTVQTPNESVSTFHQPACTPRLMASSPGSPTLILKLLDLRLTWPLHCSGLFYACNSVVVGVVKVESVQQSVGDGRQDQADAGDEHQADIQAVTCEK